MQILSLIAVNGSITSVLQKSISLFRMLCLREIPSCSTFLLFEVSCLNIFARCFACNGDDITRHDVCQTRVIQPHTYLFFQTPYSFKRNTLPTARDPPMAPTSPYTNEAKERVQFLKGNHTCGSRPTRGSRQTNRSPT